MLYPIYIFFGLAPSFLWLLFFLRKDSHPEPNRMVLKIFFYGMVIAIVAAFIEIGIFNEINRGGWIKNYPILSFYFYSFIGIALVEEIVKYLVVRRGVLSNPEFDEPTDAMLYMIISALGFAALENILVLLPVEESPFFLKTLTSSAYISAFRFVGATLLHALCSGIFGYFLALSLCETRKRTRLLATGLLIATFLHGLYNFSIIEMIQNTKFIILPIIILIFLAIFATYGFRKLKKTLSICKIK